tara:strand:+ start:837 stop:1349 length:513 start_codon:yes stop_codon:yes gene_type:complete
MQFRKIDPRSYDWEAAAWWQKTAIVRAHPVPAGTQITTRMANGLVETQNVSKAEITMLVTNPAGEQYLVAVEKFKKRYDARGSFYAPKAAPVKSIPLYEDVRFTAPWGEEMRIACGGVLVRAGEHDIYGIQGPEFEGAYQCLPTSPGLGSEVARKDARALLAQGLVPSRS